ncbi:MAG: hypothetical protein R3B92_04680 [Patescibacteria group bacterium]
MDSLKKYLSMRTVGIIFDALREIDSPTGSDLETLVTRLDAAEKKIEDLEKRLKQLSARRINN